MSASQLDLPFSGDDAFHEECAVFGIYGHADAAALTVLGLHALQHRGQEASGIVSFHEGQFIPERHKGLVGDIFGGRNQNRVANLKGANAVGHNRYSTAGGSSERNIQPMFADLAGGGIAIAHNGNLTNARGLRDELVRDGAIFQSTSDTEVIIHLAARSKGPIVERLTDALRQVEGAYSLVALTSKKLIGMRDPWGVRPLVLGRLDGAYILASETCAFDIISAEFVRDIEPGEMVVITKDGLQSHFPFGKHAQQRFCIFEYIYFARPDSVVEGRNVYDMRKRAGEELAKESPALADIVVPVPDSSIPAAIGYANQSHLPFELGIIRNHYVGRTFIEPTDGIRHFGVKKKHNPNRATLKGKRVILIDDSIVRGTTSKKIVQMVRDAGASQVHFRVASPPTSHSCFYGVDTPNTGDLLAHGMDVEEMRKFIGADSLAFITMDGLYKAMGEKGRDPVKPRFCDACFSGDYPIRLADLAGEPSTRQLSLLADVA
ncbi:MAG: amidophosphoribosyltransferase [Rhizomicrobium sp.]